MSLFDDCQQGVWWCLRSATQTKEVQDESEENFQSTGREDSALLWMHTADEHTLASLAASQELDREATR